MTDKARENEPETGPTATTLEEANELGFLGTAPDPEPNESYAVGGELAKSPPGSPGDTGEAVSVSRAGTSSSKSSSSSKSDSSS